MSFIIYNETLTRLSSGFYLSIPRGAVYLLEYECNLREINQGYIPHLQNLILLFRTKESPIHPIPDKAIHLLELPVRKKLFVPI